MNTDFAFLYEGDKYPITVLGKYYKPPAMFTHGQWQLVADLKAKGDGKRVKLYEMRLPATFYKIEVGDFVLSTGTVDGEFAGKIALEIQNGMLGLRLAKDFKG